MNYEKFPFEINNLLETILAYVEDNIKELTNQWITEVESKKPEELERLIKTAIPYDW